MGKIDKTKVKTIFNRLKKNKPDSDTSESEEDIDTITESDSEYASETEHTSDSSYRPPKSRRRVIQEEEVDDDEDDYETCSSEDDEEMSKSQLREVRKEIAKIFPSKYMSDKIEQDKKNKLSDKEKSKSKKNKSDSDDCADCDHKHSKSKKKNHNNKKSHSLKKDKKEKREKSKIIDSSSNESESEYEDSDEIELVSDGKEQKLNIIFTINGNDDEFDNYFEEEEDQEPCEENDEDCNSDDEKTFMKENYQELTIPKEDTEDSSQEKDKKDKKKKSPKKPKHELTKKEKEIAEEKANEPTDIESEYLEILDLKKHLTDKLQKNPNSKIIRNAIKECTDSINKLIKSARSKNAKSYFKMINAEKKKTNEIDYFRTKLSNKEQLKIMRDLKEVNEHIYIDKPYRLSLLQSKIPARFKAIAMTKLNMLRNMEPGDSEYHKIKNWVDTFMKIPFNVNKNLSVSIKDGVDVCNTFLKNAKKTLDECVYGLDDAKMQIMQMVGQWISNPMALGSAIAIKGAMGTGKTTLVKEGISKILGREFAFIALGGATDSSFLEGHSYTYEGSTWGKIVQILIDSKCMNPVIYFDELDKVSDTPRGQEIIGILTHLTDTSQNSQFHDKYFSEIDFDLSKCLFIFSYNDESMVNPILRDRMYRIQTKGYDAKDKNIIAKQYLLPKIEEQINFNPGDIIIPDDTVQYIISNQGLTKNEEGVRNLKRCLEIIYTKLNLFRLVKPENNHEIFTKNMNIEVSFPFTVLRKHVDILIKNDETVSQSILAMYV
jgi:ATP-dependent Lon protease